MSRPRQFLDWAVKMFGPIALNRQERVFRFVEEAIELAQAEGMPSRSIISIMERVYARQAGQTSREIGQAQVTLECLAEAIGLSANEEADREWNRVQNISESEWKRRHASKVMIGIAHK